MIYAAFVTQKTRLSELDSVFCNAPEFPPEMKHAVFSSMRGNYVCFYAAQTQLASLLYFGEEGNKGITAVGALGDSDKLSEPGVFLISILHVTTTNHNRHNSNPPQQLLNATLATTTSPHFRIAMANPRSKLTSGKAYAPRARRVLSRDTTSHDLRLTSNLYLICNSTTSIINETPGYSN